MLCKLHIKKFQQPRVELKTGHHCSSRPPLLHFPFPWEAEEEGRDTRTPTPSPTTPCRRAARPWGSTRSSSSSSSGSPPPQPPPGRRSTPSASRRKVPSCSFSPPPGSACISLSWCLMRFLIWCLWGRGWLAALHCRRGVLQGRRDQVQGRIGEVRQGQAQRRLLRLPRRHRRARLLPCSRLKKIIPFFLP